MNRRTFVLSARGAMLAEAAPSDQVHVGIIGSGGRGRFLMQRFARDETAQLTSVCDVYEPNLEAVSRWRRARLKPIDDIRNC